jgi:hypothetical protein
MLMLPAITADVFLDRAALAGDYRFIGVGSALDDDAIHRNAFSRPHSHQHAGFDLSHRARDFRSILDHDNVFAFRRQERLKIARGSGAPGRLEIAAERKQHQHHGGGVEIDLRVPFNDGHGRIDVC